MVHSDRAQLQLYTYKATSVPGPSSQPSPLPSTSGNFTIAPRSQVLFSFNTLPWLVRTGDYLEIRRIGNAGLEKTAAHGPHALKAGGEALKSVVREAKAGEVRDGYVFRVGADAPNIPINQIHIPETVASAFCLQHRLEVQVMRVPDPEKVQVDFVELRFSQYLGRADMWRLGMSLENSTIHVGEKVSLAGGAVRADIQGIWRGKNRYSSGIVTPKTKTIYRSRSAQVYIFIQLCQETWEFDEDGERYSEKVVHGFLPELFNRWAAKSTSHLVTIIFFARVHYNEDEVRYLEDNALTKGLIKDYTGRWCKDFYHVAIDFERRSDWHQALGEIKQRLEKSEKEILLDFHVSQLRGTDREGTENRILGRWSFAYEGNVLEAVNLALNPFDEHYIDRDLSRTGMSMAVLTPGTGHFAVDKNLLRLTTERMVDHGISLDLVCLTKMPLHSVPLFSYVSKRPKGLVSEQTVSGMKTKPTIPDLLYFDAKNVKDEDCELADCYSIPKWVNCSFYSKTHDKPFRMDRFVPRCKMYEIQMLGVLDHNLTRVAVPLLAEDDIIAPRKDLTEADRKKLRDDFDAAIFGGKPTTEIKGDGNTPAAGSLPNASYQSARLLATRAEEGRINSLSSLVASQGRLAPLLSSGRENRTPEQSAQDLEDEIEILNPLESARRARNRKARSETLLSDGASTAIISKRNAEVSPSRSSIRSGVLSGASTPKLTPVKRLRRPSSRSSVVARFGPSWLLGALTTRSQLSLPTAAAETVARTDVSSVSGSRVSSPSTLKGPSVVSRAIPGAPVVLPATPSPSREFSNVTQPLPIAPRPARIVSEDDLGKSHRSSVKEKVSRSENSSWGKVASFNKSARHVTVNPCNPNENPMALTGDTRRWQHVRPRPMKDTHHLVKWTSLCTPACLPLTTDYMPTASELQEFYEANSYDIACFADQLSFLIRADSAAHNLPLAIMREMASQRLTQNFQYIVLPHQAAVEMDEALSTHPTRKVLLPGDSTQAGLRAGGASEVLRDASGAIYLSWSNHIHRLAFDSQKQSVTVQRFVRKIRHTTESEKYTCLVWASQMNGFNEAKATFHYPNVEARLNFNYLDRLIAGEEDQLTPSIKYWRTRYILIPSGKDPSMSQGIVPSGENFNTSEILMAGASKVLEILERHQWKSPTRAKRPLRLIPTTFDPSACVLDEGLMTELERLVEGKEKGDKVKKIAGLTLQTVGEMMCKPNNGLIIRERWWGFNVHEDSFSGEIFCEWLVNTFEDIETREQAVEWARSLFEKGLIEHVANAHGFFDYNHFFYRLRPTYDINASKRKQWFGSGSGSAISSNTTNKSLTGPRDLIERHAALSTSPSSVPVAKLTDAPPKKRKIRMSQTTIIDLDPSRKSDRAEVAILHADVIHNARNAFHFELNWLGVTAGLLDELRLKCSAQAERYALRFVEAPVEQIKDVSLKSAYRQPIPIPLALSPPIVPDLHLRLAEHGTGQSSNFFEYSILTQKFGFVLDVESSTRYPDNIEVEYSYRGQVKFEYSQFCHKSGLALVQCLGGEKGFLWCDNRLFIAAPQRRGQEGLGIGIKQEEARCLRMELESFCNDIDGLKKFYEEVLNGLPLVPESVKLEGEKNERMEVDGEKDEGG
ncbi:hypothetical protein TREMEDRAFT_35030 [Tremella mesenterica DSM 1558]|uniref:uncharacterized protein n=1 Tax=Tremella mesenterica (strain ATCC 24925 / CBS 8224 / DSM 1558 / NBRC 9311 / NRRL Y-6157 / RJB 2259-6 / UBC 559-6) TaxID=578456 RepID=UPI00032C3DF0|nr:uncharacterized protein TREMEDRAFT_35030 [Tremella mesenterica DSM 1558]EIW66543.1 hypothetical protein TREMEDRAFT_35030 [Tremella mesenterica DSM 1558]